MKITILQYPLIYILMVFAKKEVKLSNEKPSHISSLMKIFYIPAILLFLAFLELPYGYYTFLRLVVTGMSLYAAFGLLEKGSINFWIMLAIAALFNPLIPVHLTKEIWLPIDVLVGIYFSRLAYKDKLI